MTNTHIFSAEILELQKPLVEDFKLERYLDICELLSNNNFTLQTKQQYKSKLFRNFSSLFISFSNEENKELFSSYLNKFPYYAPYHIRSESSEGLFAKTCFRYTFYRQETI